MSHSPESYPPDKSSSRVRFLELFLFATLLLLGFAIVRSLTASSQEGEIKIVGLPEFVPDTLPDGSLEQDQSMLTLGLYEAVSHRELPTLTLSKVFTPSVRYWEDDILEWSEEYGIDPNLIATVMQIESCGYAQAGSGAGAMGLFQVMPFHFDYGEQPFDPDTNALRGMAYLNEGLEKSNGHAGLALAGYNGGHSVIFRNYGSWAAETRSYYRWGTGIYREASAGWDSSPTVQAWLDAGGSRLCSTAEAYLNIGN